MNAPVARISLAGDNLPGTATHCVYNTPLNTGTNTFYLNYSIASVPNFIFTTPVDNNSPPLFSWTAQGGLDSEATSQFVVSSNAPVGLISVRESSGGTGRRQQTHFLPLHGEVRSGGRGLGLPVRQPGDSQ